MSRVDVFRTAFCSFFRFHYPIEYITLVDKLAEDMVRIYWLVSIVENISFYFILFPHPFDEKICFVWTGFATFICIGLLLWWNITIILKYVLIFHPWVIPDSKFTDEEIWRMARNFVFLINLLLSALTMVIYENHPIFRLLVGLPVLENTIFFDGPLYVWVASLILLILYKLKLRNSQLQFQKDDTVIMFNLLIKIAVFIIVITMILDKILVRHSEVSFIIKVQLCALLVIVKTALPLLFIYNTPNMWSFVLNVCNFIVKIYE